MIDYFCFLCKIIVLCRLRDERGDIERVIAMDKAREGSHNGKYKIFNLYQQIIAKY